MKVSVLKRKDVDVFQWNRCVEMYAEGLPYVHTSYLDAVCQWDAVIIDDYDAVLPLPTKKKFGVEYVYTPALVQQLGVIGKLIDYEKVRQVLEKIPKRYRLVELKLNQWNPVGVMNANYVLDLHKGYSILKKAYSKNHLRNLSKCKGLELRRASVEETVDLFYIDKGGYLNYTKSELIDCIEKLMKDSPFQWEILGVYSEGVLITSSIWVETNQRMVFLFSGNSKLGKDKKGMFYLMDQVIQSKSNQNKLLDFEGSNQKGLARFYEGFGSFNKPYGQFKRYLFPINLLKRE